IVCERDTERTTFAGIERMNKAGHAAWHHPCCDRARIEKRAIDLCARCVQVAKGAGRGRSHKSTPAGLDAPLLDVQLPRALPRITVKPHPDRPQRLAGTPCSATGTQRSGKLRYVVGTAST